MVGLTLILACTTPGVNPRTTQTIIEIESKGKSLSLNRNDGVSAPRFASMQEAVFYGENLRKNRINFDIGLMQLNSSHLERLKLSVEAALDPCTNIKAGTQILKENYARFATQLGPGPEALTAALSAYNTGSPTRGKTNGYVTKFKKVLRPYRAKQATNTDVDLTFESPPNFGSDLEDCNDE